MQSYETELSLCKLTYLSVRRRVFSIIFLFKLIRDQVDFQDVLSCVKCVVLRQGNRLSKRELSGYHTVEQILMSASVLLCIDASRVSKELD